MAHRVTQPARRRIPTLAWLILAATVVIVGVLTVTATLTGPPPPSPAAQQATIPPARVDPATTDQARPYLQALDTHKITLEPHEAIMLGEAVCTQRRDYHATLATLAVQIRGWVPHLTAINAATLVDDADRQLCPTIH